MKSADWVHLNTMDPEESAFILLLIVVGIGLAVAALAWRQSARKRLERLSPAFELGTCRPGGLLGNAVEGLYRGYTCRYTIQYASQYDPGGALLRIAATGASRWAAEPINTGSRLLVKLGLVKDMEIGDRVLDERFRFSADDDVVLQSVFGSESARDAMHTLAATENFKGIDAHEDRIDFRWGPRSRHLDEDSDTVRFRLEAATNLANTTNLVPRLGS